jgi:type VI secretion system ImpM family protein
MMSGARPALFGKLPSHGDFVCRGLAEDERAVWDDWASRGLTAARAALGEGFDAAHDTAPLWAFAAAPGALGPAWSVGAMAPSTDRVGRRFVIVTACLDLTWPEVLAGAAPIAAACTEAIYAAFRDRLDVDAAFASLSATLPGSSDGAMLALLATPVADGIWWTHDRDGYLKSVVPFAAPETFVRLLSAVEDGS